MQNLHMPPYPTRGKFGSAIFAGFLFSAACPLMRADVPVTINAAIVCKADLPQNVVSKGPGISVVNISGSIALWETQTLTLNTAATVQLFLNTDYSKAMANGTLPPIIPFISDVRSVRLTLAP